MIREIVHVSASLREDGGGAAHLGRVIGRTLRRHASRRGLAFRGLHLPAADGHPALDGYSSFGGSRARLAAAVAALQLPGRGRRRLIVFDHPGPSRIQGWLPGALHARYAIWVHGIDVWRKLPNDLARALEHADRVVTGSRTTIERARPFLPPACQLEVIQPGIEGEGSGGQANAELLERAGTDFALIVSRLPGSERYKGHDELLDGWPAVRSRVPSARLVVVGDGSDRERLEARCRELGLEGAVIFLGFVDAPTLSELYRRSALFVLPSRDEGFGLVFVEAMAAGRPCIALGGTAPAEFLVDGEGGRLVPAGDTAALAAALADLLSAPERARQMGEAGRGRYEREFTPTAFEERLTPLLDRLVADGAR